MKHTWDVVLPQLRKLHLVDSVNIYCIYTCKQNAMQCNYGPKSKFGEWSHERPHENLVLHDIYSK